MTRARGFESASAPDWAKQYFQFTRGEARCGAVRCGGGKAGVANGE